MKITQMAWRNVLRNPRRSLLSVLAVFIVSLVLVVGFSVLEGMKADTVWNAQSFSTGTLRIINPLYEKNKNLSPLHLHIPQVETLVRWSESQRETLSAVPRIVFGGTVTQEEKLYLAQGWGVDFAREEQFSKMSSFLVEGRLPGSGEGVREAVIGWELARQLGLRVGDKFTFLTPTVSSTNMVTLRITGLMNFPVAVLNTRTFLVPLDRAQYYLRMDGAGLEILVKTDSGTDLDSLAQRWSDELSPRGLEAEPWTRASVVFTMVQVIQIISSFIAVLFIALGSGVVVNTMMMVVFERRKEIGTLSALGMPGGTLVRIFLVEAMILGLVGSSAGVLAGTGVATVLSRVGLDLTALMAGIAVEFPAVLHPQVHPVSSLGLWGMIVGLSSLAALLPSSMAARMEPIEALRD